MTMVHNLSESPVLEVARLFMLHENSLRIWARLSSPESNRAEDVLLFPPLVYASKLGLTALVERLLQEDTDIDACGSEYNALQAAVYICRVEIIELLLINGANVNARGPRGNALELACEKPGNEVVVQMLLDAGADVNAACQEFALCGASRNGDEKVVRMLINAGANVNIPEACLVFTTPLCAASRSGCENVVQILVESEADVNDRASRETPLISASDGGNEQVVRMLLSAGADVNATTEVWGTALHAACARAKREAMSSLMSVGANVGVQVNAAWEEIVRILLDAGADVNAQWKCGPVLAMLASYCRNKNCVQLLLDHGATVDDLPGTNYGNALYEALRGECKEVVQLLMRYGATIARRGDPERCAALDPAQYSEYEGVIYEDDAWSRHWMDVPMCRTTRRRRSV